MIRRKVRDGHLEAGAQDGRKKSGKIRRVDVLEENLAKKKTMDQLEFEIKEFDSRSETHKEMIRILLSDLSPVDINNLRYRMFAPHYDEHMRGHERAIRFLIRQLKEVEGVLGPEQSLIKDRILEASCGTGTIIELLCQEFGSCRASKLNIIANDISDEMKAIAKEKLEKYPAKVTFTSQDLKSLPFQDGSFRTVIISQTMHLITDDDVLAQERAHHYMHISDKRHLTEKMQFFRRAFDLLEPGGTLIIIDEWPALLTDRGGPLGAGFAYLFNDGLRPIDERALRHSIMGRISGARMVTDFVVPIDAEHGMHLIAYRKEPPSHEKHQIPIDRFHCERERAARTIQKIFRTADPQFVRSNWPESGEKPWIDYIPLSGANVLYADEENISGISGTYDSVIFDRSLHEIEREVRHEAISNAVRSVAIGGSLIVINEWEPPEGSTNPVKRGTFNHIMDEMSRNLIFEGEVRLPIAEGYLSGMYGLHYRRVF